MNEEVIKTLSRMIDAYNKKADECYECQCTLYEHDDNILNLEKERYEDKINFYELAKRLRKEFDALHNN